VSTRPDDVAEVAEASLRAAMFAAGAVAVPERLVATRVTEVDRGDSL
jgi:hypothetical protein